MSSIGIGTDKNDKCEISFSANSAPLQPTPRVDKFALRNNDLLNLARQLERDYAGLRRKLILERELRENAEQSYTDCKATLVDERYCHGQSIVSLKQAASDEIKAANERASSAELALHNNQTASNELGKKLVATELALAQLKDRVAALHGTNVVNAEAAFVAERELYQHDLTAAIEQLKRYRANLVWLSC